ncbi:MAG: SurA N-terminal domain-containing protein [Pelagibacterales bacterium]|nr:SurA N-terminal domain-containing protein [Pelagibacterales bacterium]
MLNNIRNFSKTWFAKILLVIIIIPFVFWGMGGVFSGGNTNNIAKINNQSISTQDFINYLNSSKIDTNYIKDNIDENVIEELLAKLISTTMLSLEITDLSLSISDKVLNKKIIENKNFLDENKKFSRIKYEKFLLSSNLSAPSFEFKLRESELKNNLFAYISGGIKSPSFLTNNIYKNETKKITISYINLENVYKKKEDFLDKEISKFIDENKDTLKEKNISFNYSKITPQNLMGINEYNETFFKKIDEIENEISNGSSFEELSNKYKFKSTFIKNLKEYEIKNYDDEEQKFYKKILKNTDNKIELLDENDYYILYEIVNVQQILPQVENAQFKEKIKQMLSNRSKFEFNNDLMKKISKKEFSQSNFDKLSETNSAKIESIEIKSIKDNEKFSNESVKFMYSMSKNSFTLAVDEKNNIYLVKIVNILENNISKSSKNFAIYTNQANLKIRDQMFTSYDFFLNDKYKVEINQKTLDRVKNYFR